MAIMKNKLLFFPYKTILISVFFFFVGTTTAICANEPPPPGLVQQPTVQIDFYLIPMIVTAIVFAFFNIKKTQ